MGSTCEQYSFCKRVTPGGNTPSNPSPRGACVSNDPNVDYSAACSALEATCEQFSFCKRASSLAQSSAMHSEPVRPLRRLRRSAQHVLFQREGIMQKGTFADEDLDGIKQGVEDQAESVLSQMTSHSRTE